MSTSDLTKRLLQKLEETAVVDCHSHTADPADYAARDFDLFTLNSYFLRDMSGILGVPRENVFDGAASDEARWAILRDLLDRARNTTYARHHLVVYREFFGLEDDELNDHNWRVVNENIRRRTKERDWYAKVTDRCNLVTAVRNVTPFDETWDKRYFTPVVRMERVLRLHLDRGLAEFEQGTGCTVSDSASLRDAIAKLVDDYRKRGAVGVKFGHAYWRTLCHDDVSDGDAERALARIRRKETLSAGEIKALQDWAFRAVVALAGEMNMVVQIHTGVQTHWGHIPDSNPLHLLNVLREHPNVRFDLFHAGYPYAREMGMLGKHYPNAWLNMCWMYVISTAASRQILSEWIDLVPGHRLLGFGSDVGTPEFIYAHLVMARACIAGVLAGKVENDFLSEQAAMRLIERMMLENPCELYGLDRPTT